MISWLQRVLQRHYKWLFTIMLAIIIVAFVFTIGGSPGIGRSKYSTEKQMYYGINLNDPETVQELFQQANLSNILNTGKNIANNQIAETLALSRPVLLKLADKLEIDHPNEYELADYIKTKVIFKDINGKFDPKKYEDFLNLVKSDPKMDEGFVRLVLSQDMEMERVLKLLGGPGYVLPFEAELSVERQKTVWSVDVASLDFADFNSSIDVPEDKLEEFYINNKFNFATPSRIEVVYASFPAEQYISKVPTPSEDELKNFFDTHLSLFLEEKDNLKPFSEIKNKVIEPFKRESAIRLAAEAANNLQYEIYENHIPFNSDKFKAAIKKYKLKLTPIQAFDAESIPNNTPLPKQLLQQALSLNENHYYSDVATNDKGAYIVFFKKELPISIPAIEEIKNELREQYLAKENLKLLESKAKVLDKTINTSVKGGKSFKQIVESEGLKVSSFDKFNILAAPSGLDKNLLPNIQTLNKGEVSSAIIKGDKFFFIHVNEKEIPAMNMNDPEVQSLLKQLDVFTSAIRSRSIVSGLISDGLNESTKKKS